MSRAIISVDALRLIRELPAERVKDLAEAQNVKAHKALADMTRRPKPTSILGPVVAMIEEKVNSSPSDEAIKVADQSLDKATKTHSKEDYVRAYSDSALAVVAISEQDASSEKEWQTYIVQPTKKYVIEPLKGAAVTAAETVVDLSKQAASGLNQTILLLGIAYIAISAIQKTATRRS